VSDDLVAWAKRVPIKGTREFSSARLRLVLIELADHADRTCHAFPGAPAIAEIYPEFPTHRKVQDAFEVLASQGLIRRNGKVGRAVRWHVNPDATCPDTGAHHVPREVPRNLPRKVPGYRGTNRTEPNKDPRAHAHDCDDPNHLDGHIHVDPDTGHTTRCPRRLGPGRAS
jgi:hypothetical protein